MHYSKRSARPMPIVARLFLCLCFMLELLCIRTRSDRCRSAEGFCHIGLSFKFPCLTFVASREIFAAYVEDSSAPSAEHMESAR